MQYKKKYVNDKILEAGLSEYLQKGFRGGNISVIAENAGIPIGNLYRYFDGKSGLLDALIKPAYTQIPKMIDELYLMYGQGLNTSEEIADISEKIMSIFDSYKREIIVLADKCKSTRYDDFCEKLTEQIHKIILKSIYDGAETDEVMAKLLSVSLTNSFLDILRMDLEREKTKEAVLRIMKFYFCRAERA